MNEETSELLQRSKAPRVLLDIACGALRPPLTDYDILPVPEDWAVALPSELVAGHELMPVFCDADKYTLYCVDRHSLEILKVDIEEPWPPLETYRSWQELAESLVEGFQENQPSMVSRVRELFSVA